MKKKKIYALLISIAISLGTGLLSALITPGIREKYEMLIKPPAAPPGIVFPIVWTVLYILMGVASYIVYAEGSPLGGRALGVYFIQLAVNFLWPALFFGAGAYLAAFVWIIFLWVLIFITINRFHKVSPAAAYLMLPYLLWTTFAAYLNLAVYILNR